MPQTRAFNLIDEVWIPVAGSTPASLRDVFAREDIRELGGNPIQKIALLKLFQAIAQAAHTPVDDSDWAALKPRGLGKACLAYLDKWHDAFWLYGEKPFLQMPAIKAAKKRPFWAPLPNIATENNALLFDSQRKQPMSEPEKALLVVTLMGFGFALKRADNSVVLTKDYPGKHSKAGGVANEKPGTSLGNRGYQHHFLIGSNLLETIWFNTLTTNDLAPLKFFPVGIPPWERMPEGEDCATARALKKSLMGRLVPISKFVMLAEDGIHYSDGILHDDHNSDVFFDPSIAIDMGNKKVMWVDPEKQLWRNLPELLTFLSGRLGKNCFGLKLAIAKACDQCRHFTLWAGGIHVSGNTAGVRKPQGKDDFLESRLLIPSDYIDEDEDNSWFTAIEREMRALEDLSINLHKAVKKYFEGLTARHRGKKEDAKAAKAKALLASSMFWQKCDRRAQNLVDACGRKTQMELRREFDKYAKETYNSICPRNTARQLEAWAANMPYTAKYLKP